ncbi:MAG: hypothetical protein ACFFAS_03275 [Promethearchaeota archaeon]
MIIGYYEFIILFFNSGGLSSPIPYSNFYKFAHFLGYKFLVPLYCIPSVIVLDKMRDWRVDHIRKKSDKKGIILNVEI